MTHQTAERRLTKHVQSAKDGRHSHSAAWVRELLRESLKPRVEVVAAGFGIGWEEAEIAEITKQRLAGARLTNHTAGGGGILGFRHTEDSKRLMSEKLTGRPGHPHTETSRSRIGRANKGRPRPDLAIQNRKRALKNAKLEPTEVWLRQKYINEKLSVRSIAAECGLAPSMVETLKREYNIPSRSPKEHTRIRWDREKAKN